MPPPPNPSSLPRPGPRWRSGFADFLARRCPNEMLGRVLPERLIFYGHLFSDNNQFIMRPRYRYPTTVEFLEFVEMMQAWGYQFLTYEDFFRFKTGRRALITFDDGFQEVFTEMAPVLARLKIPFMVFISTRALIDPMFLSDVCARPADDHRRYYLDMSELEALKSIGAAVGYHTRSHHRITSQEPVTSELFRVETEIEPDFRHLFSRPAAFAYPFEGPEPEQLYDEAIYRAGFVHIFDTKGMRPSRGNHHYRVPMDVEANNDCDNPILYSLKRHAMARLRRAIGLR